jgi:hypothetical protein
MLTSLRVAAPVVLDRELVRCTFFPPDPVRSVPVVPIEALEGPLKC